MYNKSTALILLWLRVPPEPHTPHGNPASLRVFRAGRNFYRLKLGRWIAAQILALAGIVFWVGVFVELDLEVHERRAQNRPAISPHGVRNFEDYARQAGATTARGKLDGWNGFRRVLVEFAHWAPGWVLPALWIFKIAGIMAYAAQLPLTFAILRLDYELRWYMVTDRSLRIRHGIWKIAESTMSFANIQQVVVSQGPLQRLLGLADVKVQSAGGGAPKNPKEARGQDDLHVGLFHHVTNASEIRDLILARLRSFREAGLGDPDERIVPAAAPAAGISDTLDLPSAAREFAEEVRALRATLG